MAYIVLALDLVVRQQQHGRRGVALGDLRRQSHGGHPRVRRHARAVDALPLVERSDAGCVEVRHQRLRRALRRPRRQQLRHADASGNQRVAQDRRHARVERVVVEAGERRRLVDRVVSLLFICNHYC